MVCGRYTPYKRGLSGMEAAFCSYHMPVDVFETMNENGGLMEMTKTRLAHKRVGEVEQNILWCLHLGANTPGKIAKNLNAPTGEVREKLEGLEEMYLIQRKNFLGHYELTADGLKAIEPREMTLDTKLIDRSVRHGEETTLWIVAKNSGDSPMSNASVRIVVPKFIEVNRYGANYMNDGGRNIVEFPLTQLHPGEVQSINFKVKGFLTGGAVSSTYKIEVRALTDEKETDRRELDFHVVD